MKFKILQDDFSKYLNTALRFTNSKMQLPVLGNILLKTEKGRLYIKATNLETSVVITAGAKVESEGEITMPARVIAEIVANLNAGQIDVEVDKEKMAISNANFKSVISGMNTSDFPKIADKISTNSIQMSSQELSQTLRNVLPAVSSDETRPILTGVLVVLDKNGATFVGTDGFRLSKKTVKLQNNEETRRFVLPKNTIAEIVRLSSDSENVDFALKESDNQVVFAFPNLVLASRIIDGEFPDFERIIPKQSEITVKCDKEEMLRAVKLASIFARESANVIKISFPGDGLHIQAESSKSGSENFNLEAKIEGAISKGFTIAFNYRFVEEFLTITSSDEVVFKLNDANSPSVFLDPQDAGFLHIIMPIRLQS